MKVSRVLGLAIIGALLVAWVPFANANISYVHLMVRTDKTTYETGELVQIFVLLWNSGSTDVTLHFGSACQAGFSVEDLDGRGVYNQSIPYTQCLTPPTLTVQSGQTFSFAFLWNQTDSADKQVSGAQSYLINGFLTTTEQFPRPTAIINITLGAETPTDAGIDAFGRFYQDAPPISLLVFLIPSIFWSRRLRNITTKERLWLLLPPIGAVTALFYVYETFMAPQFFQNGYLGYPISSLLQTTTIIALMFSGLSIPILALSVKIDKLTTALWNVSTGSLFVGFFLAFSNLNILAMEWRTFLEYDWEASILNSLVGYLIVPLGLLLEMRVFGQRFRPQTAIERMSQTAPAD